MNKTEIYRLAGTRVSIVLCMLIGAFVCLRALSSEAAVVPRRALRTFPNEIAGWHGTDLSLSPSVVQSANADEYLNRAYIGPNGAKVELYVGFYRNQRTDKWIHSPKNCLPSAGWEPVSSRKVAISVGRQGPALLANDYLIQNGLDRLEVLYWYQGRGRSIASEYQAKFWLMYDAATRKRTDGALIRVLAPVPDGVKRARDTSIGFVADIYSSLNEVVP